MRSHVAVLEKKKIEVVYVEAIESQHDIRILIKELASQGVTEIQFINPTDYLLERRLRVMAKKYKIKLVEYENELFINTKEDLESFFKPTKKSFFKLLFISSNEKNGVFSSKARTSPSAESGASMQTIEKNIPKEKRLLRSRIPKKINIGKRPSSM